MSVDQKPPMGPADPGQWNDKPTVVERPALLQQTPPPSSQASSFSYPTPPVAPAASAVTSDTSPTGVAAVTAEEEGTWLEDGFYYQGSRPPKSDKWDDRDWVEIPHEHYIPISKSRLIGALWKFDKSKEAGQEFKHFIELVESIYHFHYHQTLNELKEDYEYFAPEHGEELREGVSEEELIWRQRRFVANFIKTMLRGNFIPFKQQDRIRAKEQNYLFDLAIDVQWDTFDNRLIGGFLEYADGPEGEHIREDLELDEPVTELLNLPQEFNNGILLFYRGIGRDRSDGLFVMQKVDALLGRFFGLVIWPIQWFLDKVRGHKEEKKDVPQGLQDVKALLGLQSEEVPAASPAEEDEERSVIFDKRWVRRVNIRNQKLGFRDLTKASHLQEPSLERMLCLFRLKPPQPPKIIDRIPLLKKLVEKFMGKKEVKEHDWTIYIKMFKNIPLADSDIVFPEKKVRMKSFDLAMLIITFLLGFVVVIRQVFFSGPTGVNKTAAAILMTVLVSYGVKLFLGYRRARANYMARMTTELYNKSLDNDLGVLQYLVDTLEEQEVKEATLSYFFLWNEGRPMTQEELDGRIESFVHEHFDGLEIDFEVDDALDKVIEKEGPQPHKHLPLVIVHEGAGPNGENLYEAKPLEEALRIIDHKWDNFYTYNE